MHDSSAAPEAAPLGPWLSSRPRLLRLCLRFTRGDHAEAEDLLSDACLKTLEARREGVSIERPLAFSVTVIANLARDRRRAAKSRLLRHALADADTWQSAGAPAPDQQAAARERLQLALESLEQVPGRQRRALLLRTLGDEYPDIAQGLGTSEQNARKLVQSARAAVQMGE